MTQVSLLVTIHHSAFRGFIIVSVQLVISFEQVQRHFIELAKGNIVELGGFGSFWLRTETEGAEAQDNVRSEQITGVLPRFNPGKEFKRALETIQFTKS